MSKYPKVRSFMFGEEGSKKLSVSAFADELDPDTPISIKEVLLPGDRSILFQVPKETQVNRPTNEFMGKTTYIFSVSEVEQKHTVEIKEEVVTVHSIPVKAVVALLINQLGSKAELRKVINSI